MSDVTETELRLLTAKCERIIERLGAELDKVAGNGDPSRLILAVGEVRMALQAQLDSGRTEAIRLHGHSNESLADIMANDKERQKREMEGLIGEARELASEE